MLRLGRAFAGKAVQKEVKAAQKSVTFYRNGELVTRSALTLKKQEDVEAYVVKLVSGYFRTLHKEGVSAKSNLDQHGLDSLDAIEICMMIEEDLGYKIAAETLPAFTEVQHFVNYINTVEEYKATHHEIPLP
jgi:acyl carrier protein